MGLAGASSADQHDIALLGDKVPAGKLVDECLVDRRALELEVGKVFGERQLGDGELVLDRPRLLLADLGVEQITDDALRFVLAFVMCSRSSSEMRSTLRWTTIGLIICMTVYTVSPGKSRRSSTSPISPAWMPIGASAFNDLADTDGRITRRKYASLSINLIDSFSWCFFCALAARMFSWLRELMPRGRHTFSAGRRGAPTGRGRHTLLTAPQPRKVGWQRP
jgi:hypothetical protein